MTALTKPVRRSTEARVGPSRPITVELIPPFTLRFREKGRRVGYELTIHEAFTMAAKLYAERERKRKVAEKKARRAGK